MQLLILSAQDVQNLMSFDLAYKADEEAYKAYSSNAAVQPPIINFGVEKHNGEFNIKTSYSGIGETMGVKIIGGFFDNAAKGLPAIMGIIALFDGTTGAPVAILDGTGVTYYRTAAASAYAAKLLARPESSTLAIIGTGTLAHMHVQAMMHFFNFKKINILGICPEDAEKMASELKEQYPDTVIIPCTTGEQACADADIINTATPSKDPILKMEWIRPGTHINAFGADAEGKQELDETIIASAKVVVDVLDECVKLGECQTAIRKGLITREDIYAEIGDIALGNKPGREYDNEITVFDSTGMALQDICTVTGIYEKAKELGIGTYVEM